MREAETRKELATYSRSMLEQIAYAAWQWHRETNVICSVHDEGDDDAECICDWVNQTRRLASDELDTLLPE